MTLLRIENLVRRFDDVTAVDDVSFDVEAGSIVGFIGPNGAGKTTTMRILATLDQPTSGEATIDGMSVVADADRVRPRLGYMPDAYGTWPNTTVHDYLDFFARAYGLRGPRLRETLERIIDFTGLDELVEKETKSLSKGMKQRLALARILVHDPDVLILDEPAAGLDPRSRVTFRELLKVLAERGKAILISSHILTELSELVHACAIIERGRLVTKGSVDDVRRAARTQSESHTLVRIELAHVRDDAEIRIAEQPHVQAVRADGRLFAVDFAGADDDMVRFLRALVAAELPIISFRPDEANLEDVFMAMTEGEDER